jgi:salicylate hydroxylase
MDTVIVGAGLGGLCLAQGLRRRGIGVTVLEADPALEARKQGYRLNINVSGASALTACLPDPLVRLYRATSHRQLEPTVTVCTPDFQPVSQRLATVGDGPVPPSAVDRATLRRILAAGLSDAIRYGMRVTDVGAEGYAVCADGSKWTADLVVAADGVWSAARRSLLPGNEPVDLGVTAIYGRTLLTPQVRGFLPESVFTGRLTSLVDTDGLALALGAWDPWQDPREASAQDPPHPDLSMVRPYLMWVVIGTPARLGLTATDPASLHKRACSLISDWDAGAQRAVLAAQVPGTFLVEIRYSRSVPDWPSNRVTFLGDAVHTMTPAGGEGANTAMRDAAALAANLGLVQEGRIGLQQAVEDYEAELRTAGNDAINRSQHYAATE